MDPADTDSLPHAISMQGLLLGKHEQLLKEVMDSIQTPGFQRAPSDGPGERQRYSLSTFGTSFISTGSGFHP